MFVAACVLVSGCGGTAATFDPASPCGIDGRAAGAYPDLEARLPGALDGAAPTSVDSGRNCSDAALGSLVEHQAAGIRFAGATWDLGGGRGVSSAIFELAERDLPAAWMAEFYETGARTAKRTGNIETSRPAIEGIAGAAYRLDTLNDLSLQTVVSWQDGGAVRAVLVASPVSPDASRADHDALVAGALASTIAAAAAGG